MTNSNLQINTVAGEKEKRFPRLGNIGSPGWSWFRGSRRDRFRGIHTLSTVFMQSRFFRARILSYTRRAGRDRNFSANLINPLGSPEFVSVRLITHSKAPVPPRLRADVERVLISQEQLARRVKSLAREIEGDFRGRELVVVSLLNGTVMFLADLIRHLNLPLRLDFIGSRATGWARNRGS